MQLRKRALPHFNRVSAIRLDLPRHLPDQDAVRAGADDRCAAGGPVVRGWVQPMCTLGNALPKG
jgi:hypothetical protein